MPKLVAHCWLLLVLSSSIAIAQTVTVRSGNGIVGGRDSAVTFLQGPADTDFTSPFTQGDFSNAQNGPAAFIVPPNPLWVSGLAADPNAKWIGTNSTASSVQGYTALYAVGFTIPNAFTSASLTFNYAVDDELACTGCANNGVGTGPNKAIFLNGTPVCAGTLVIANDTTAFTQQHTLTCNNVSSLLHVGTNWLYIDAVNFEAASGLLFSATITTADANAPASFAYVANYNSNNVSAYTINSATGALTALPGSPFAAGSEPAWMTLNPTGTFAYVANAGDGTVSAYTINPATGALTAVPGSPFPAGSAPRGITVDPTGKFAYVANYNDNTVSAYTINSVTGALIAISGSPFPAGSSPLSVTVDPTGRFSYVADYVNFNNVSAYTINPATGGLTPIPGSPFAAGTKPDYVAVDPTGNFAYVANEYSSNVSAFTINSATGALTAVPGSPFAAGSLPLPVTVDPTGRFAYVVDAGYYDVLAYTINSSTGALTPVSGSPFPAGDAPRAVTVYSTGQFIYVANEDSNNVSAYTINSATGGLTPIPGSPFAAGSHPYSVVTKTGTVVAVPNITAVVNAANFQSGPISPGEIITIGGSGLGPQTPSGLTLDQTGKVATSVGGVQVLVGGTPAPLTYVSATQINCVVPYEIQGLLAPSVQLSYQEQPSNVFPSASATTVPALFTANGSGSGPAAAFNQDLSYNSPTNPAAKGSIVVLFMTGEGQTSPPGVTGKVTTVSSTPPLTPQPLLPVAVLINGQPATIAFYGEAPTLVSGVMQLNVQIPSNVPSGNLPLQVSVGGNSSPNRVTISVQ